MLTRALWLWLSSCPYWALAALPTPLCAQGAADATGTGEPASLEHGHVNTPPVSPLPAPEPVAPAPGLPNVELPEPASPAPGTVAPGLPPAAPQAPAGPAAPDARPPPPVPPALPPPAALPLPPALPPPAALPGPPAYVPVVRGDEAELRRELYRAEWLYHEHSLLLPIVTTIASGGLGGLIVLAGVDGPYGLHTPLVVAGAGLLVGSAWSAAWWVSEARAQRPLRRRIYALRKRIPWEDRIRLRKSRLRASNQTLLADLLGLLATAGAAAVTRGSPTPAVVTLVTGFSLGAPMVHLLQGDSGAATWSLVHRAVGSLATTAAAYHCHRRDTDNCWLAPFLLATATLAAIPLDAARARARSVRTFDTRVVPLLDPMGRPAGLQLVGQF